MKRRHVILRITLCLLLFACAVTTRAADKWLKLSSEHFDMLSCSSERDSKDLLVKLEQFREFFFKTIPQGRIYDPRPLIFVFDSEKQYAPYSILTPDGKRRPGMGYYLSGLFLPRIMMINLDDRQALHTIFHEYTHALVRERMGDHVPAWLNEGIAEVYETFTVNGDEVSCGKANAYHATMMQRGPLIPMGTLFAVTHRSSYYNESEKMSMFYAQSWLLVHHAMFGAQPGKYDFKGLLHFADKATIPGAVTADAFAAVFGANYKDLEYKLQEYLRSGRHLARTAKIPAKPIRAKITVRPATDAEREIELAGMRWRAKNSPDIEFVLLDLVKKYPDNPRVYEILAELKMYDGDPRGARDYLRKAVERQSTTPLAHVWLLRNYYSESRLPRGYIMPQDMDVEYTHLVDRALELAPDCMEAYEMLAIIESQRASIRGKKVNEAIKALSDMPDPGKTLLAVATVYWRLKKYNAAEVAIARLMQNPKSSYDLKSSAHDLLCVIAKETGKPPPKPLPAPPQTGGGSPFPIQISPLNVPMPPVKRR